MKQLRITNNAQGWTGTGVFEPTLFRSWQAPYHLNKVVSLNPLLARLLCPWARHFNLLLSTQAYKWVPAQAGKVLGSLCKGLETLSQQHYELSSVAQWLVKRRWAPLDALKVSPPNLPLPNTLALVGIEPNRVFFLGGLGEVPPPHPVKILPIPPIRHLSPCPLVPLSPFLDQGLSPPSRGSSPKIQKILIHFCVKFDYF